MKNSDKLHWYGFSFVGKASNSFQTAYETAYTGYPVEGLGITKKIIKENIGYTSLVPNNYALLNVMYLGYMTKEEFAS